MKNALFSLGVLVLTLPCYGQQHLNTNEAIQQAKTNHKPPSSMAWLPQNKQGFFFTGSQSVDEYDASLKPKGIVDDYDLTPVDIIAITREKLPADASYKDDKCTWANFVKIKHQGKEKIVFGSYVLYPTKQYKTNSLSLWETERYKMGVTDKQGLTGCDNFHTLLLKDSKGVYHAIEKNYPLESQPEEPQYINLVKSDVAEDSIDFVTENYGTLSTKITRNLQDETKRYRIHIFPRQGDWWGDASEPKPALYDKRTMSSKSLAELEDMALARYKEAGGERRHPNRDLMYDYIEFTEAVIRDRADAIDYPFSKLTAENAIKVATSADKKLRFYSFNTRMGGTMQMYDTLYQSRHQTKDKNKGATKETINTIEVSQEIEGDNLYFVSKIHSLTGKTDTYYVVIANRIASSQDATQTAMAYRIKHGKLEPVKLFKTAKKSYSEIAVGYNFFSALDRFKNKYKQERPIPVIRYDKIKGQLLFALVKDDRVTDKDLVYEWTGDAFQYVGVK